MVVRHRYWTYPTQSNTGPINSLPDTGNHANFFNQFGTGNGGYTDPNNYLTSVGAFNLSPGPSGTFDQGGDVFQWNETLFRPGSADRTIRGGSFNYYLGGLDSMSRAPGPAMNGAPGIGFRVASVPEPNSTILLLAGIVALGVGRRRSTQG